VPDFGIFATRALTEGKEIVVGWASDDANAARCVGEVAGVNGGGCVHFFRSIFLLRCTFSVAGYLLRLRFYFSFSFFRCRNAFSAFLVRLSASIYAHTR
jgi:hypothetical protein